MLVGAREIYVVDEEDMTRLLAEGLRREAVGDEFEPRRTYVFVVEERVRSICHAGICTSEPAE
jgi:hypothetical protein